LLLVLVLLAGCVKREPGQARVAPPVSPPPVTGSGQPEGPTATVTPVAGSSGPLCVLLRTDLGLADGEYVREADSTLASLAQQGRLRYQAVGSLPVPLESTSGENDIGLPVPQSNRPGEMTLGVAAGLLEHVPACDVLVIGSGSFLPRVEAALSAHAVSAKCVLLLDEAGLGEPSAAPPVPLLRLRYDIKHMAFLTGVAAAQSSSLSHFGILYSADDPQGSVFARAAAAGAKFQSNGSWTESIEVKVGSEGYVTPELFSAAFEALKTQGGPNFAPDHYILDLGRATPTIMLALTKKPYNAYVLGSYANFCPVRPARIIGCALKRPDNALAALLGGLDAAQLAADPVKALSSRADKDGVIMAGLAEHAVDFTDFTLYKRYKPDGADIEAVVARNKALIETGEITAKY
jgi:hypothetical protein